MTAPTHPISMGATPRDETVPCTLVEVCRHYAWGGVNDVEPIPPMYEPHAQFHVTEAGARAIADHTHDALTVFRVTASILVKAESAAIAKDRFSDLIDLDACPSDVEIDAVEHGTGARRPIEFTRSEALALFDLTMDFEGPMPGELDAAANKLGAMLGSTR